MKTSVYYAVRFVIPLKAKIAIVIAENIQSSPTTMCNITNEASSITRPN
jgi:hypothetical protein